MNTSAENKYERYILPTDWNLYKFGSTQATKFVVKENFLAVFKIIYGDQDQETSNYYFPLGWLYNNVELVESYFQKDKIDAEMMMEMGVDSAFFPPIKPIYEPEESDNKGIDIEEEKKDNDEEMKVEVLTNEDDKHNKNEDQSEDEHSTNSDVDSSDEFAFKTQQDVSA